MPASYFVKILLSKCYSVSDGVHYRHEWFMVYMKAFYTGKIFEMPPKGSVHFLLDIGCLSEADQHEFLWGVVLWEITICILVFLGSMPAYQETSLNMQ